MNVKKIMLIFQSFYVDVSIEELTLTLPISFVKRFEYTQMTFHKESFLLIKEKKGEFEFICYSGSHYG